MSVNGRGVRFNDGKSANDSPGNKGRKDDSLSAGISEQGSPKFLKEQKNNNKPTDGSGKYTYSTGDMYDGAFVDGLRHGNGVMVWTDGRQYRGGWERDKPHGRCEEVMPDRTTYKGEYEEGLRHGHGLEISVYGDEYNGDWMKGQRHGVGEYFSDGLHYEGEWKHDKRWGNAKCLFRNGDLYEGEFQDDLMQGNGSMLMANGCKYEGSWSQGKMDGHGRLLYPSGDIYEGEWKAGSRSGFGRYRSVNGSLYEGEFKNGKRDGKGVQTSMIAGPSSIKTSVVPFRLVEGERYDGEWRKGKRAGQAQVHIRGRLCYQGQFMNNERDGEGTAFFKDGTEYEGAWKEGKMHGPGRMHSANGNVVEGVWEAGVCKEVLQGTLPDHMEKYNSNTEDLSVMQHFEKGKSRLLPSYGLGGQDSSTQGQYIQEDDQLDQTGDADESGNDNTESMHSVGFLNNIDEEEEDILGQIDRLNISGGARSAHTQRSAMSLPSSYTDGSYAEGSRRASHTDGPYAEDSRQTLPAISKDRTGHMVLPQEASEAAQHDEMVEIAGRYGVPIKGTFDEEGNYIPPVTEQTYKDWHAVNHLFLQSRESKRPGSTGGGAYAFDANRQAGYGEGSTPKLAKANVPRKTDGMVAGPGEFSYKRWRAERGPF